MSNYSDTQNDMIDETIANLPGRTASSSKPRGPLRTRTGDYLVQIVSVSREIANDGRPYANLKLRLTRKGKPAGHAFCKVSWESRPGKKEGQLDLQSRLMSDLMRALDIPAKAKVSKVLENLEGTLLKAYLTEYAIIDAIDCKDAEQKKAAMAAGRMTIFVFCDKNDPAPFEAYLADGAKSRGMVLSFDKATKQDVEDTDVPF